MALTKSQNVTILAAIIGAVAVIIAALVSRQSGIEQHGERNVVINQARDVEIDQSIRTSPPEAELTGFLMPSNESDPYHMCDQIPSDAIKVFMGSNVAWTDKRDELTIFRLGNMDIVTVKITPRGVYLSATIFREDGRIVAKIVNNQFMINPNNYFELLRPNRHEMTILDKYAQKVLFVRYINEKTFYIEGVFQVPGKPAVIVTNDKISIKEKGLIMRNDCFGNYFGAMFSFN